MNVGFITNIKKDIGLEITKNLVDFALSKNLNIILTESMKKKIKLNCEVSKDLNYLFCKSDFVVVLGGDGTILRIAKKSIHFNTKILGINLGTLGYLADVEQKDAFKAINKIIENNYKIEKRMMLDAVIEGSSIENESKVALNEVTVASANPARMIKISIKINGKFVDTYRADGILISTPTGSTAYNLSAGGPILKPDTELIIINYICPHALFSRPYVISGNDEVKIYILGENDSAIMSLDGQEVIQIKSGESIKIKKSSFYTNIIKTTELDFFDILRRKMVNVRK